MSDKNHPCSCQLCCPVISVDAESPDMSVRVEVREPAPESETLLQKLRRVRNKALAAQAARN